MKSSKIAIGAIVGAGIGIVAGILTAPKSGRETRDDIKRKADDLKGQANAKKDSLLFKAEEISDEVRTKATDAIDSIKSSVRK
jgi:gas vesicle protein